MITDRQQAILNFIVSEYVSSAAPVPSQSIAFGFSVSSATIRNDMADLEGEGYIRRPHISSGGIPSHKGYRRHVETLPRISTEPDAGARLRRQLEESAQDIELWTKAAAEMLSDMARNMAVVSPPKAPQARLKRIELVHLQEYLALLVMVLQEAKTKQRILHLRQSASQGDLTKISNKLNALFSGATAAAITPKEPAAEPAERQVIEALKGLLAAEDAGRFEEPLIAGLRHLMNQPEFLNGARLREVIDFLEDKRRLRESLSRIVAGEKMRVVIGRENDSGEIQECSVIIARYGQSEGVNGVVAVVGPTRLNYRRTIASVQTVSDALTGLVGELS
ncbi:MAG: heat-inducible transcription repressor HrcA [Chloroflexi bacterium]|nr:heat-inducible transcription repressor HrcA [Chloroflexota bacterium]